jgi:hypothetical protein
VSLQFSRPQNGGITPSWISLATCSLLPLIVRLLIAHAASFCVWNSPCRQKSHHLLEMMVLLMHSWPHSHASKNVLLLWKKIHNKKKKGLIWTITYALFHTLRTTGIPLSAPRLNLHD